MEDVESELRKQGWALLQANCNEPLTAIACRFGEPISNRPKGPLARHLLSNSATSPNSLRGLYGLGELPLHTDCAYYRKPPNLIFFRAKQSSQVATTLVDSRPMVLEIGVGTANGLFAIKGIDGTFVRPLFHANQVRWDRHCMRPLDEKAKTAQVKLLAQIECAQVHRHTYDDISTVLIVDNYRMLHGREDSAQDPHRTIESVLVYSKGIGRGCLINC